MTNILLDLKVLFRLFQCFTFLFCVSCDKVEIPTNDNGKPIFPENPNVLFISVDDLNDWIGVLGGHPQAQTPNIDRLARRGLLFRKAYTASPSCNPSRTALLTGKIPSNSGVYKNPDDWRKAPELLDVKTLPRYFKDQGYTTLGSGKLFHDAFTDQNAWDAYWPSKTLQWPADPNPSGRPLNGIPNTNNFDWGGLVNPNQDMSDWQVTDWIVDQLEKDHDKPFFISCGIYRPHLPWFIPQEYIDAFPIEDIQLPVVKENDLNDVPASGAKFARTKDHVKVLEYKQWEKAVQGYLASIKFADACVGKVLDALENSDYAANTLVVLWSDHGWALGEKTAWRKFTLWEEAGRVPLIFSGPGIPQGAVSDRIVNLIDLYPTIVEYADLPEKSGLDGNSITHLLVDPNAPHDKPSLTTHFFKNHSIRKGKWRYTRYEDGKEELYDHDNDPMEHDNLAGKAEFQNKIDQLSQYLPTKNVPRIN